MAIPYDVLSKSLSQLPAVIALKLRTKAYVRHRPRAFGVAAGGLLLSLPFLLAYAKAQEYSVPYPPQEIVSNASYDIFSGTARRTVVDITVPGSPGVYPLQVARHFTVGGGASVYLNPRWSFDFCYLTVYQPNAGLGDSSFLEVWYPDGGVAIFVRNGTTTTYAKGSQDRLILDQSGNPAELMLSDGGRVIFQFIAYSTMLIYRIGAVSGGAQVIDPHGLVTSVTLLSEFPYTPVRLEDSSGRWIDFSYAPPVQHSSYITGSRILGATASTGESVTYGAWEETWQYSWTYDWRTYWVIESANYADGTGASYLFVKNPPYQTSTQGRPLEFRDTRAVAAMPAVKYEYSSGDWWDSTIVKVREPNSNVVVSTRNYIGGTTISEVRGDGYTQTLEWTWMNPGTSHFYSIPFLSRATDYAGNTTRWYYDARCLVNRVENGRGFSEWLTNHPQNGRPTAIQHPDSTSGLFVFADYGGGRYYVASEQDELGRVTTFARFPNGSLGQSNYADGSNEGWAYNGFNQPTVHRFRNGAHEYMNYDLAGRLMSRCEPYAGGTAYWTYYTYYPDGDPWEDRVWTVTDPRGYVTTYEYDLLFVNGVQTSTPCPGRGLVTKITSHDGTYKSFGFDPYGNKIWEENELRQRTTYSYDAYRRVRTVTDPLGRTTERLYGDTSGEAMSHTADAPKRIIAPSGKITSFQYDGSKRQVLKAIGDLSADTKYWRYEYDAVGNLTREREQVDWNAGVEVWRDTTFTYDLRNRKIRQDAPLGRITQWEYDAVGNVTKTINPDSTFTRKEYDVMNRVSHEYDELNQHTGYTYHASGKVNAITDPRGNVYTHTYDAADRIATRTYPGGSTEQWECDAVGNVSLERNRSNHVLRRYYDNRNRETERHWDGGAAPSVWTYYDAASRVTQKANWHGLLTYTYDAAGQMTLETQKLYGPTSTEDGRTVTIAYTYDADGNRTVFESNAGTWIGYAYNQRQQVTQIQQWIGGPTAWATYSYHTAGERRLRTHYNGTESDYNYDGAGRLNYLHNYRTNDGSWILMQQFGHDLRDRRTWQLRDQGWGDTFEYQADSQLFRHRINVWRPDQNFWNAASFTDTFAYDAAGNRTSWNQNGAVTSYGTDALNQYTSVSGLNIQHGDGRGNITALGGWTFSYDAENRPNHVVGPGYDMWLCYDAEGRLAKIFHATGPEYRFHVGSQQFLRQRQDGSWIDFTIWGTTPDEVISRYSSEHFWLFYHQDPLNSTIAITDINRNIAERYRYDAFGGADIFDASWNPRSTSAVNNRWQFTGQEWWPEMDLHNYKARFYSSELGRFLQNDPIRFDGGDLNLFRYVRNSPSKDVDPAGLSPSWGLAGMAGPTAPMDVRQAYAQAYTFKLQRDPVVSGIVAVRNAQNLHLQQVTRGTEGGVVVTAGAAQAVGAVGLAIAAVPSKQWYIIPYASIWVADAGGSIVLGGEMIAQALAGPGPYPYTPSGSLEWFFANATQGTRDDRIASGADVGKGFVSPGAKVYGLAGVFTYAIEYHYGSFLSTDLNAALDTMSSKLP